MSIAWGSLVLLIMLLPGVLFFVGTNFPDKFTREAEARSQLGQLAGALLIAFVVHGFAYSLLSGVCGNRFPCIDFAVFLETVTIDPRVPGATDRIGAGLLAQRWWIFTYVLGASAAGIGLGAIYGWVVAKGRFRGLSRHSWVYDLNVDGLTYAYVLTDIKFDERILMYKGFLRGFGLQKDGRFSYVVLTDAARMYMRMAPEAPETSGTAVQRVIGSSTRGQVVVPSDPGKPRKRRLSLFVVEGEDIANVVFDVLETPAKALSPERLRKLLRDEAATLGIDLTDLGIDLTDREIDTS